MIQVRKHCRKKCPEGTFIQCIKRVTSQPQGDGRHPGDDEEWNTVEGRQAGHYEG